MFRSLDGKLRRRDFLAASALTAVSATVPIAAETSAPNEEWRNKVSGMTYRRLGRTGFMVSSIGMGGDDVRPDNCDQVLWAADQGLNYFDTAPQYGGGQSERGFAAVHKARGRDKFFQGTKVNMFPNRHRLYRSIFAAMSEDEQAKITAEANERMTAGALADPDYLGPYFNGQEGGLRAAIIADVLAEKYAPKIDNQKEYTQYILNSVEGSLRAFGSDHVDVLLMRGIETPYELSHTPEVYEAFEVIKKAGKARFLGFSAHSDPAGILNAAIDSNQYAFGMIAYHFLDAKRCDPVIEKAKKADFGVLSMKASRVLQNPFNRRELIPARVKALNELIPGDDLTPFQKGFKFALGNPNLSGVVIGMTTIEHAKQDVPLALQKA